MNLRIFALIVLLSPFSFVRAEHHHQHYPSAIDLLIEKKNNEIFWAKVKTAAVAGVAGFVVGWIVAKS